MGSEGDCKRKPRFLCLHEFRSSGEIMKKQIFGKWASQVLDKLDLVFVDAPFPCRGKPYFQEFFGPPPYYEWFQYDTELTRYDDFDECLEYIEQCMMKHGPFDGLLGFSQGAILSAALPGLQDKGMGLTKVPKIKYLIIISGGKFYNPLVDREAYSPTITCPSLHFIGEQDHQQGYGIELLESFVDPVIIHHPEGSTIPRFDEKGLEIMINFIEKMQVEINK